MNQNFMKTKSILPLVMAMSIPNILSMLINSLYSIIDSYFVAKINEDALTAISIIFPIQNLSLAVAVGFSIGINATIAILLGRGEEHQAGKAAVTGLALCAVHGFLIMIFCRIFLTPYLRLFTEDAEVLSMGMTYASIVLGFSVMLHLYIGVEKIYQAVGLMRIAMSAVIFGCVVNVILDPLMIFGIGPFPEMGIAGAAIATGISQTLELFLYLLLHFIRPLPLPMKKIGFRFDRQMIRKMYGIGIPASLNIALPSLLISVLNQILSSFDQMYLNILGIYYKLQTFVYLPANGLIQGIRPLIGYNFGAGEYDRVKKIYRTALCLSIGIMISGSAVCFLLPEKLIGLFANSPETITAGAKAMRIISSGFAVSAVSITACGALEGLGMGIQSLMISLLRYTVLILPLAWICSLLIGAEGVWHAFWITELLTACISFSLYHRTFRKESEKAGIKRENAGD